MPMDPQVQRKARVDLARAMAGVLPYTPAGLRALGAIVLTTQSRTGRSPPRPTSAVKTTSRTPSPPRAEIRSALPPAPPMPARNRLLEAALQADTAARGAANAVTFGGADHFAAGMNALGQAGGLEQWGDRYEANLAQEEARNAYDATHRSAASAAGQLAGTLAGFALMGPARGAVGLAPRIAGAARLSGREKAALLGGGAVSGLGGQVVSDLARGQTSTAGDKVGAAAGGLAGVAALPLGPARAGAVGGWVTSAAQDAGNGRAISLQRAADASIAGGLLGVLGSRAGATVSDDLPSVAKGRLGEVIGEMRSTVNGKRVEWGPKRRDYLKSGSFWVPDGWNGPTRFEYKFGSELTPNQIRAQAELKDLFQLYQSTPEDIGSFVAIPSSAMGAQMATNRPRDR